MLRRNVELSLGLLKKAGGRCHLILDETCWSPEYTLLRGIHAGKDALVGGVWCSQPTDSYALLPPNTVKPPVDKLCKLSLHCVMKHPATKKFTFEICCLPRPSTATGKDTFLVLDSILAQATASNGGLPPLGCAFDGATINGAINRVFLGLAAPEERAGTQFFVHCKVVRPELKYWPFGCLYYKNHLLTGSNGAFHIQKRLSLQLASGCKVVVLGSAWCCLSRLLAQGLPHKSYCCVDVQSDKAAVQRLSVPWIAREWACLGNHVMGLLSGLLASISTGSSGFTKKEMAFNGLCLYYMMLLHRKHWAHYTLAGVTIRNVCSQVAHSVTMCLTELEHKQLQEIAIEEHFSRCKEMYRGVEVCQICMHSFC